MNRCLWIGVAALGSSLLAATSREGRGIPSRELASRSMTRFASAPASPLVVVADPGGGRLFVADATRRCVLAFDTESRRATTLSIAALEPTGLAVAGDGSALFVTGIAEGGVLVRFDLAAQSSRRIETGTPHPTAPTLSPDGKRLWVCHRFANRVECFDSMSLESRGQSHVGREPIAAVATGDELIVAQHLPSGSLEDHYAATSVLRIREGQPDSQAKEAHRSLSLPNGSTGVRGLCLSHDGRYAFVTHILARYLMPTTQIERGWINTNALSIVDLAKNDVRTVLLDDVNRGAANPWGVAASKDGQTLFVAHSGTHELSRIDLPGLLAKLANADADVSDDLAFLGDLRKRIRLEGDGPRGLVIAEGAVWIAEYFSGSLGRVSIETDSVESYALAAKFPESEIRRGERLFHDAELCLQQWQSCASCHPDARTDGLNWDLMNDGFGNPRNTKSMLFAHRTPPAMTTGIRPNAEAAVRAGIRHILFAKRPEEEAKAMDAYLSSLEPVRGPAGDSASIRRGAELFEKAGCHACHPAPLYTNKRSFDLGSGTLFDTPSLVEIWRSAPYLNDGRAADLESVLTKHNPHDRHGATSELSRAEIADLVSFLRSL
jgi:DNA-binding beta-propeller fold protein YncE/mono/diheme cytochrome c family protein